MVMVVFLVAGLIQNTGIVLAQENNVPTTISGTISKEYIPPPLDSYKILPPGQSSALPSTTPKSLETLDQQLQYAQPGSVTNLTPPGSGGSYTLLEPLPCSPGLTQGTNITCNGNQLTNPSISGYLQYMFNLFIAIAAVAAVFMIVLGGFEYMTSDAIQGKSDGKEKIGNAIKGLLMVVCSYLILRSINPQFVDIPSNIVDPINIPSSMLNNTFFDNMLNQAQTLQNKIDSNNNAATAILQAAQADANQKNAAIMVLQNQLLNPNLTTAERNTINVQIASLTEKSKASGGVAVAQSASLEFNKFLAAGVADKNSASIELNNQKIDAVSQDFQKILVADGQIDAANTVKNAGTYTTSLGIIASIEQVMADDSAHLGPQGYVQSDYNSNRKPELVAALNSLPDGTQKTDLANQITKLESEINTYTNWKSPGLIGSVVQTAVQLSKFK